MAACRFFLLSGRGVRGERWHHWPCGLERVRSRRIHRRAELSRAQREHGRGRPIMAARAVAAPGVPGHARQRRRSIFNWLADQRGARALGDAIVARGWSDPGTSDTPCQVCWRESFGWTCWRWSINPRFSAPYSWDCFCWRYFSSGPSRRREAGAPLAHSSIQSLCIDCIGVRPSVAYSGAGHPDAGAFSQNAAASLLRSLAGDTLSPP